MTGWRQLPLPFDHAPQFACSDFLTGASNAEALAWLDRTPAWPQRRLALWGGQGSGKTHLLHRWAARNGAGVVSGPALRFDPPLPPSGSQAIAIDEADAAPERALLHLLNATAEAAQPVLLAGQTPPARWPLALADLASRLRAVTAVQIHPPGDELLRSLLARLLAERQIAVPAALQDWLRLRLPRTPWAMREAAARLDRTALAAGRPVTRVVAAAVLADIERLCGGAAQEAGRGRGDQDDEVSTQSPWAGSPGAPGFL